MYTAEDPHDWRNIGEQALQPIDPKQDEYSGQSLVPERYQIDLLSAQGALWNRAAELLVRHGQPLCYANGPIEHDPQSSALSTGALLLGEPQQHGKAAVMQAVRIGVADSLRYKQLPVKQIEQDAPAAGGEKLDAAIRSLAACASLTTIRFDAMVLSTTRDALVNNDAMRGQLREAKLPRLLRNQITYGTNYGFDINAQLERRLDTGPQIALWWRPLPVFGKIRNQAYIGRPAVPQVRMPAEPCVDSVHRAVEAAITEATEQQSHTDTMLSMLMDVTQPVRTRLGSMAIAF